MRLKSLVFSFFLTLSVVSAFADNNSKTLLDAMSAKVASFKTYEVQFSVGMDGVLGDVKGRFVVSGERYYVAVDDSELFFDGKLKYTYSSDNNEVVIELPDPTDNSILSNPTRFFTLYNDDFKHIARGATTVGGVKCESVELTPKKANSGYSNIIVSIDTATSLPKLIKYRMDGSAELIITVDKITPNLTVPPSTFTFDKSKYKGVEIIDFR